MHLRVCHDRRGLGVGVAKPGISITHLKCECSNFPNFDLRKHSQKGPSRLDPDLLHLQEEQHSCGGPARKPTDHGPNLQPGNRNRQRFRNFARLC